MNPSEVGRARLDIIENTEDGFKLAFSALKKTLDKNFDPVRIDAAYVSVADKRFTRLTKEEITNYSKGKK